MKNSKSTLLLFFLTTVPLSLYATTHNIADLKDRMGKEKNIKTIDRNALQVKYNREVDQLFDPEALTPVQRNMLFEIKQECLHVLLAFIAQTDCGSTTLEQLDIIKLTAECFAKWGESVAAVTTEDYLQAAYRKTSPELVAYARRDGYGHALKVALSKKKKGLQYMIDGLLEQAVRDAIDDEMSGK